MAAHNWKQQTARLGGARWARAGVLAAALMLGGTVEAIAATAAAVPEASKIPPGWQLAVVDQLKQHQATARQPLTAPAKSAPSQSAPRTSQTPPETAPLPAAAPLPTAPPSPPPGFTPNPDYTAPLPVPDSTEPLQPLPAPGVNPLMDTVMGRPQPANFADYRLGPGDSFFVNVRQFPDLSFQATLDIQGNVVVPLQGVVTLEGLTIDQAAALITEIYDQYVIAPDVSMTLVAQRGVEVTILGEVVRPGYYPLNAPQISAALLSAGGTTNSADLRSVLVQRRLPDGQLLERNVDLFTPLKDGQEIPNVALQDGDVILVSRLDPAALDEYDRELVSRSTLATPTITVRFLNYGSGSLGGSTTGVLTALELPNGSRFADALVRASLNPDTSNLGEVALVRFDEAAGRAMTMTLDGGAAFRGIPSENPPLQQNDVIVVNRTLLAKLTYALNTFTQPFRDVLGFLLFFEQLADSASNLFSP